MYEFYLITLHNIIEEKLRKKLTLLEYLNVVVCPPAVETLNNYKDGASGKWQKLSPI